MGRNEIRLRRQSMSSGRIARHRNYGDLMARHEKEVKVKRIIRVFMYFLVILFMIMIFMLVRQIQKTPQSTKKPASAYVTAKPQTPVVETAS